MSAPHTNLDKQGKRHKGPLGGMLAVVLWALVLLAGLGIYVLLKAPENEEGGSGDAGVRENVAQENAAGEAETESSAGGAAEEGAAGGSDAESSAGEAAEIAPAQ